MGITKGPANHWSTQETAVIQERKPRDTKVRQKKSRRPSQRRNILEADGEETDEDSEIIHGFRRPRQYFTVKQECSRLPDSGHSVCHQNEQVKPVSVCTMATSVCISAAKRKC